MPLEKREIDDLLLMKVDITIANGDTVADTIQLTPLEGPFELTRIHVVNEENQEGTETLPDSPKFLFVYDTAGTPIVGTTGPVLQFSVPSEVTPAGTITVDRSNKGVAEVACHQGIRFENGLAFAIGLDKTSVGTDALTGGTTGTAENDVVTVSFYGRML